jgi:hypothetical protein
VPDQEADHGVDDARGDLVAGVGHDSQLAGLEGSVGDACCFDGAEHVADDSDVDFNTVVSWSNIKKLEDSLLALDPSALASLDSQSLVDAIVANPAARPEAAPYDFRENQLPEFPDMAGFRIFTRDVVILELQDGQYEVVSTGSSTCSTRPHSSELGAMVTLWSAALLASSGQPGGGNAGQ